MSRGFIKEGDQEEIPRVPMRAYLPQGVPNYVTKEGLEALKEELKALQSERIKAGDDYITANFIDATIKLLVDRINNAVEVDLSKSKKDTVSFGAWVRYNGRVVRIVGVDEADVNKGLISFISPIAKALIGKKVGDVIELKGSERIKVEEVSFEPMELTQIVNDPPIKISTTTESRPRKIIEEKPATVEQTQPLLEVKDVDLSAKADKPCRLEPKVNDIEFLPIVNGRCMWSCTKVVRCCILLCICMLSMAKEKPRGFTGGMWSSVRPQRKRSNVRWLKPWDFREKIQN